MIKFRKDLLIISVVTALLVGVWFGLSIYSNTNRVELVDKNMAKLIRLPKYKIEKGLFVFLVKKTKPVETGLIYDANVQPITQAELRRRLESLNQQATVSAEINQDATQSAAIESF